MMWSLNIKASDWKKTPVKWKLMIWKSVNEFSEFWKWDYLISQFPNTILITNVENWSATYSVRNLINLVLSALQSFKSVDASLKIKKSKINKNDWKVWRKYFTDYLSFTYAITATITAIKTKNIDNFIF